MDSVTELLGVHTLNFGIEEAYEAAIERLCDLTLTNNSLRDEVALAAADAEPGKKTATATGDALMVQTQNEELQRKLKHMTSLVHELSNKSEPEFQNAVSAAFRLPATARDQALGKMAEGAFDV